jgi:hypothetical protein
MISIAMKPAASPPMADCLEKLERELFFGGQIDEGSMQVIRVSSTRARIGFARMARAYTTPVKPIIPVMATTGGTAPSSGVWPWENRHVKPDTTHDTARSG